ncbi:MAG TPA: hypothetical protein VIK54_02830 [Acidimicrobiia bacterium]
MRLHRSIVMLALAAIVGVGCGGEPFPATSTTPRVSADPSSSLQPGLVTSAALATVPALASVATVPTSQGQIFENPDPRAPCGAKIAPPRLSDAIAEFQMSTGFAFEGIANTGAASAKRFLDANRADMRDGCPPYDSQTNQLGVVQHVVYEGSIPLTSIADDALAVREQVSVPGQPLVDAVEIVIRRRAVVGVFEYLGAPISAEAVVEVANLVARGLESVA